MKLWLCLFLLIGCRITAPQLEQQDFNDGSGGEGPSLAVIGDSISTGVLSDTRFGRSLSPAYTTEFFRLLLQGFNPKAFQERFSNLTHSFAATDEDWGLRGLIAKKHGFAHATSIPVHIGAKFGGRLINVRGMLKQLQDSYRREGKVAEYVSVLLGANDFCENQSPAAFEQTYVEALKAILTLHPRSTVLVGLIPDVASLVQHQHRYSPFFSCNTTRRFFCPPLLGEENAGAARLQAFNVAIEQACQVVSPHFQSTLRLVKGTGQFALEESDLAFDCFHPSKQMQQKLAEKMGAALL